MDVLVKMISTLPDKQYVMLLEKIGTSTNHKNYITLTSIRNGDNLEQLNATLGISKGAFNTHKSRLLKKISDHIGSLQSNHVSLLKEETARVNHIVLQNDREVSLRILFDLEDKLKNTIWQTSLA